MPGRRAQFAYFRREIIYFKIPIFKYSLQDKALWRMEIFLGLVDVVDRFPVAHKTLDLRTNSTRLRNLIQTLVTELHPVNP